MDDQYHQVVPRPSGAERLGAPSWAGAAPSFEQLASFVASLPPAAADQADASVLVPVYAGPGGPVVVLIRRSRLLADDPGHVAFPGGRIEAGESAKDAALREAGEEVGLERAAITALASLGVFWRRNRWVAAFVALIPAPPHLVAERNEVDALLEVPLAELVAADACWEERWGDRPMFFFARPATAAGGPGDLVWGLTARILSELLSGAGAVAVPAIGLGNR
ncbi:MAG TPA: CoA pyrophosphatase [Acidimicrobiales bacterium]|nr:CoA pyrophosphatase [Acidimicrobiales bacterium]